MSGEASKQIHELIEDLFKVLQLISTEGVNNPMEFLKAPELQGIAAIIAIIEFVILLLRSETKSTSGIPHLGKSSTNSGSSSKGFARVVALIVFLSLGWLIYSLPWVVLAFALGLPGERLVLSPMFFVLGTLPAIGALIVRYQFLGGFLGGAIPLASVTLFIAAVDAQMSSITTPFALFVMSSFIGGAVGALSGPATVNVMQRLGLPLPLK